VSSIRERIAAAAVVELNTGTPGGVPQTERSRTADYQPADLPAIVVYLMRDVHERVGGGSGPIYRSRVTLFVECRASGTGSLRADQAVDPLYLWVVKALAGKRLPDGAGGFLNHDIFEGDTTFAYEQGNVPHCLASTEMVVEYQRLRGDPEART
jgi:hypothetical protein